MRALLLLALIAPVPGDVTRGFDPGRPFEAGRHRGVDLAAAPGTPVRAACSGPVAFAGRIADAGIVTLRCGQWRVTHMPLARIAARGRAARGAVIGTLSTSRAHEGLHLGVRRDGMRFGYVDPLQLLARPSPPLGPAPPAGRRAPPPRSPRARPRSPRPASLPFAPWPAWAGLALVLAAAGLRVRRVFEPRRLRRRAVA